jgi:cytochrome c oxidase subunit 4
MSQPQFHPGQTPPHEEVHPASMIMLISIFVALLGLTAVTVGVAYVDLGELNLFVAMGIATVKALLVALFFMHLTHESGFNRLAFFSSFIFVALFVSITLMDSGQYQPQMDWHEVVLEEAPAK